MLAENKRLLVLPSIHVEYEALRAAQEKTIKATVVTHAALSDEQAQKLTKSLAARLQRQVALDVKVDTSLLGGAIIYAGDLVIDGSVRGSLNKLSNTLLA